MNVMRLLLAAALIGGCKNPGKAADGPGQQLTGLPVETKTPEAENQLPAAAGQTRAPYRTAGVRFETKTVVAGLEHPWGLAFLPGGEMLVTEKAGRMRIVGDDGSLSAPIAGIPEVDARGQGGLLDVARDPSFDRNSLIYWSYAEPRGDGKNGTAVARGKLVRGDAPRVEDVQVIFRMKPDLESKLHFGSRLVFARDGNLFVALGERSISEGRKQAQKLDSHFGKIVRIRPDGSVPEDNPFVNTPGARPEIWSIGHRNIQAAALHPDTGELWEVEHGARGGDEINIAEAGKDYGWPTIAYGIEYGGGKINEGITQAPGMEQPIYYWDPVLAPSGMAFYTGVLFPEWKGSLFVGGLAGKHIARLTLAGRRVIGEERLLADRARFRDVRQGPDGAVYALTDAENGELLKLVPAEKSNETARR